MRRSKNSYLKQIKYLFWDCDEATGIDRLLREYRYPGAPLRLIARNLGVADILEEDLPFEGGIFEEDGRTTIKLNALSPVAKQRFTLAHELGHLIFLRRLGVVSDCMQDEQLEEACDLLAIELLMPRQEVSEYLLALGDPSPESLRVLAKRFGVSFYAAARRVTDLGLWNRSVGMWELTNRPHEKWFVGKKLWGRPPKFVAFDLAKSNSKSVQTVETIASGDEEMPIALQMLNVGRNLFLGLITTV